MMGIVRSFLHQSVLLRGRRQPLVIFVPHFGQACWLQGCPGTWGTLCPQLGQTHCPPGPAASGPPILPRPRPPPLGGPVPLPLGIPHRPFRHTFCLGPPSEPSPASPATAPEATTTASAAPETRAGCRTSAKESEGAESRKESAEPRPVGIAGQSKARAESCASPGHRALTHGTCPVTCWHLAHLLPLSGKSVRSRSCCRWRSTLPAPPSGAELSTPATAARHQEGILLQLALCEGR